MEVKIEGYIPVRGDCGHEFNVSFARLEDEFECPTCGVPDRFTQDQIDSIRKQLHFAAASFGVEKLREASKNGIGDNVIGPKNLTYRPH